MTYLNCIGVDLGTATIKIVNRDLEFDEVNPIRYPNGREVLIPSFVAINAQGDVIVKISPELKGEEVWRVENIKGKILFEEQFLDASLQDSHKIGRASCRERV